ncbi:hypothetical protein JYT74_00010 [Crocinitomix catalasitica]|nr:hypothetical protein [Crocinitomix catalasitica]
MKNFIFLTTVAVAVISCKKDDFSGNPLGGSSDGSIFEESNTRGSTSSDKYLKDVINDADLNDFEKGNILISNGELSSTVCQELIVNAGEFDQYVLEIVFGSQRALSRFRHNRRCK